MILEGIIIDGKIVLNGPLTIPEGTKVKIEPVTPLREPVNDWERGLREAASDCGVSLSDEALSREELYD